MKNPSIVFFSLSDNTAEKVEKKTLPAKKRINAKGYISSTGKLVLPYQNLEGFPLDLGNSSFQLGIDANTRKAKSLFLIPASGDSNLFSFESAAKSWTLKVPFLLQKSGIEFEKKKYSFFARVFDFEGVKSLELVLTVEKTEPKLPYTGKPRGRKKKVAERID